MSRTHYQINQFPATPVDLHTEFVEQQSLATELLDLQQLSRAAWVVRQLEIQWHACETALEDTPFIHALYHGQSSQQGYVDLMTCLLAQRAQALTWIQESVATSSYEKSEVCTRGLNRMLAVRRREIDGDLERVASDIAACGLKPQRTQFVLGQRLASAFATEPMWSRVGAACMIDTVVSQMSSHWMSLFGHVLNLSASQMSFLFAHAGSPESYRDKCLAEMAGLPLDDAAMAQLLEGACKGAAICAAQLSEIADAFD